MIKPNAVLEKLTPPPAAAAFAKDFYEETLTPLLAGSVGALEAGLEEITWRTRRSPRSALAAAFLTGLVLSGLLMLLARPRAKAAADGELKPLPTIRIPQQRRRAG
ncbi:MAG: hypothetical protein JO303_12465 [Caulobacteraceae bacterium]|nr:hypothetical protein [Caulobacteraceae bacterium]